MKETEITVQVLMPLALAINKLEEKGYTLEEKYTMRDRYFTHFSNKEISTVSYEKLIKNSLLIRTITSNNSSYSQLTYKNKEYNTNREVISEQKYVCKIESEESAYNILSSMGLNSYLTVNQKLWIFKNNKTHFSLQEVENLGLFIEIEQQNGMENLSSEEKVQKLIEIANSLNLKLGNSYSCKKVEMLLKK